MELRKPAAFDARQNGVPMGKNNSIIPMIRDVDRGRVLANMQEGVDKIVDAIEANRGAGKGKITLTIDIQSKSEGAYQIDAKVNVKVPEPSRQAMAMFLDEASGELMRRDPRQPDLPGVETIDSRRADS